VEIYSFLPRQELHAPADIPAVNTPPVPLGVWVPQPVWTP